MRSPYVLPSIPLPFLKYLSSCTLWISDAVPVDLARCMRIVEIVGDLQKYLSWIASVQTSPIAYCYDNTCDLVLQQCKVEAHQISYEPFEALSTPIRTEGRHIAQLNWYVVHGSRAFPDCKLDFDANTDLSIRILTDATVRRYWECRLQLRMEVLLRWAASRRAVSYDQPSVDITRLHRIDAQFQTVSRRQKTRPRA